MTTFALVHGGWHGAWCWERVAPLLEARGHRVLTLDLPCDDATATFATYAGFAEQLEFEPDALLPEYRAGISEPDEAARTRWVDEDVARSVFYVRSRGFLLCRARTSSAPKIASSTPTGAEASRAGGWRPT